MSIHEINEVLEGHLSGQSWSLVGAAVCFGIAIVLTLLIRQMRYEGGPPKSFTLGTAIFVLIIVMTLKGFERLCGDVPSILDLIRDGAILISVIVLLVKSWKNREILES